MPEWVSWSAWASLEHTDLCSKRRRRYSGQGSGHERHLLKDKSVSQNPGGRSERMVSEEMTEG